MTLPRFWRIQECRWQLTEFWILLNPSLPKMTYLRSRKIFLIISDYKMCVILSIYLLVDIFASEIPRQMKRQQSDRGVPIPTLVAMLQSTVSAVALTGTWNARLLHSCSLKEMCMVSSRNVKLHCFPYINTLLGTSQWHYWRWQL